jgi:hypothetical protein
MIGVGSLGTGIAVGYSPYVNPFMLLSTTLLTIGSVLLATCDENSSIALFEGYGAIFGFGSGMGTLLAIGYAQQHVPPEFQPFMLSFATMIQLLGTTMGSTVAGTIFNTQLITRLNDASTLTPEELQLALSNSASPRDLIGQISNTGFLTILSVYAQSIRVSFWVSAAASSLGLILSIHQKWFKRGELK